ncbi:MAG: pilus assembly protein TadG-related protein [Bacilli bacterium]|nr:pilus assembly protein TadG-related protein [Bacilli bacterium]
MNNKGQTLVLFVMLLPVILVVMGIVVDLGMISITKRKIDNNIKQVIEVNLEKMENNYSQDEIKNNINNLLTANLGMIENNIVLSEDQIEITVNKKINYIFAFLFNKKNIDYSVTYIGIINDNQIKIQRRK